MSENQYANTCKCGASTYEDHIDRVDNGQATGHAYRGSVWMPRKTSDND